MCSYLQIRNKPSSPMVSARLWWNFRDSAQQILVRVHGRGCRGLARCVRCRVCDYCPVLNTGAVHVWRTHLQQDENHTCALQSCEVSEMLLYIIRVSLLHTFQSSLQQHGLIRKLIREQLVRRISASLVIRHNGSGATLFGAHIIQILAVEPLSDSSILVLFHVKGG